MPKLKCDVFNCVYNADCCCCKSVIKVSGEEAEDTKDTVCASFHKKKHNNSNYDIYKTEFATIDGINQYVSVECDSRHCLYNLKEICTADKVKICGKKASKLNDTNCETFIQKL